MSDYKYEMQMRAEELAEEKYGKDFYSLPSDVQTELFLQAERGWVDDRLDQADVMRKERRERG